MSKRISVTTALTIVGLSLIWLYSVVSADQPGRRLAPAGVSVRTVDDEPLRASTKMVFDQLANMVVLPDNLGRHVQFVNDANDYIFFEAEDMNAAGTYPQLEWVATRTGYPDLFPGGLPTELPRPLASRSPYLSGTGVASILPGSGTDAISQKTTVEKKGAYVLWVRYQTIPQLPAPFEVTISQAGKELLRQRLGEESKAVDTLAARLLWEQTLPVELNPGEVTVQLIKVKDESPGPLRGPRYVDCFLLTNDMNYIPAGGELLPGAKPLAQRRRALGVTKDESVLLWRKGRYEGFNITSWPADKAQLRPAVDLRLPRNAHGNEMILVTSLSRDALSFQTKVDLRDRNRKPFAGTVEVYTVVHMQSRYFEWTPNALFRRSAIHLAPYHTVGIWLSVSTGQAAPGVYTGELTLNRDKRSIGRIPLTLRVLKSTIPPDPNLRVLLWGAGGSGGPELCPEAERPAMLEKYWANCLAYGCNVFQERPPWPAEQARKRGVKSLVVHCYPYGTEKEAELRQHLRTQVGQLRALGWRDRDIWLQAFDEPGAESSESWLAFAKAVKKAVPGVRMWINPSWQRYQTEGAFKEWAKHVDVWWPFAGNLSMPPLLDVMKKSGKPIGFYIERGWSGMNPAAAESYFRKMPMLVAKYNIDGCGFWSATSWYNDPWDDLNTQINYAKAAVYYPGSNGPINTINFAAWREGLDELLVLRALAKARKIDRAAWAQRFLNADTVQRHDELRDALFDEYEKRFK